MIEIREATVEDVDGLQSIFQDMQTYYGAAIVAPDIARRRLADALNAIGAGFVLIALYPEPIGFTSVIPFFPASTLETTWFLKDLFIVAGARDSGAGEALMRAAAGAVIDRGGNRLDLTTDENNPGSQRFYGRLAASRIVKIYYRYDGNDLVDLARR